MPNISFPQQDLPEKITKDYFELKDIPNFINPFIENEESISWLLSDIHNLFGQYAIMAKEVFNYESKYCFPFPFKLFLKKPDYRTIHSRTEQILKKMYKNAKIMDYLCQKSFKEIISQLSLKYCQALIKEIESFSKIVCHLEINERTKPAYNEKDRDKDLEKIELHSKLIGKRLIIAESLSIVLTKLPEKHLEEVEKPPKKLRNKKERIFLSRKYRT